MDVSWKRQQNEFLNKQKNRICKDQSVAKHGYIYNRSSSVQFTEAYTRNANSMFIDNELCTRMFPAPMNDTRGGYCAMQPVAYHNVMLLNKMGPCPKGMICRLVTVHFLSGEVKIFATEDDMNHEIAVYDGIFRVPPQRKYNNLFYMREVLEFLQRGHSLLERDCRCIHGFGHERARELGISLPGAGPISDKESLRDGNCTHSKKRVPRSGEEISNEIAVGDIFELSDSSGVRLIDVIVGNKNIKVFEGGGGSDYSFAFKALFENVSSKHELLMHIDGVRLAMREPTESETYSGMRRDLRELAQEGEIYSLFNKESKCTVIFPRRKDLEFPVDKDIRKLWTDNPPPQISRPSHKGIERLLRENGLVPTRQVGMYV